MANFVYVRQTKNMPYGNGTPLLVARRLIDDDEAFVYMFGDDLTVSKKPVTKQLIEVFEKYRPSAVLGVQKVSQSEIYKYGSVKYKKGTSCNEISTLKEKLPAGKAPSKRKKS